MEKRISHLILLIVVLILILAGVWGWTAFQRFRGEKQKAQDLSVLTSEPWREIEAREPFYTPPLEEKDIPGGAVRITAAEGKFKPDRFNVKKGEFVTLVLTAGDENQHWLVFEDESLSLVKIFVEGKMTRGVFFFAPEKPGEYKFYCGEENHSEEGVMIVK